MAYTLTVETHFYIPLNYYREGENSSVHKGMNANFKNLGWFRLHVPGMGDLTLLDIGERKITGLPFLKGKLGVLISYQGQECEYRYDDTGDIYVNVNDIGQIELSGKGNFLLTDLPSFILKKK